MTDLPTPEPTLSGSDVLIVPPDICASLSVESLFPTEGPLHIDVGSGDGGFLLAMAQRHPECNFIGTERLLGRVRKTCRRAAHAGLRNVRMLRIESTYAIRYLLPEASVSVFHVLFPDPWPKRKHWRRRLFNAEFLDAVYRALKPGGEIRIKTDDAPYFEIMQEVFKPDTRFEEVEWNPEADYPQTDFEKHFLSLGQSINRAKLVKRS